MICGAIAPTGDEFVQLVFCDQELDDAGTHAGPHAAHLEEDQTTEDGDGIYSTVMCWWDVPPRNIFPARQEA